MRPRLTAILAAACLHSASPFTCTVTPATTLRGSRGRTYSNTQSEIMMAANAKWMEQGARREERISYLKAKGDLGASESAELNGLISRFAAARPQNALPFVGTHAYDPHPTTRGCVAGAFSSRSSTTRSHSVRSTPLSRPATTPRSPRSPATAPRPEASRSRSGSRSRSLADVASSTWTDPRQAPRTRCAGMASRRRAATWPTGTPLRA